MGSLLNEIELGRIFGTPPRVAAGNADAAGSATHRNDTGPMFSASRDPTFVARERAADGPCSNDNPAWDEGTLPCAGTLGVFADLEELVLHDVEGGAVATSSPSRTASASPSQPVTEAPSASQQPSTSPTRPEKSNDVSLVSSGESPSTSPTEQPSDNTSLPPSVQPKPTEDSAGKEDADDSVNPDATAFGDTNYPAFYSCSTASEEDLVRGNGDGNGPTNEALPLRFDYEMYTAASVGDDVTAVLRTFERRLAHGVAVALEFVDCATAPDIGGSTGVGAVERARGGPFPFGGGRRTLRNEPDEAGEPMPRPLGMSMDPVDELDAALGQCSSSKSLSTSYICSPVMGAMTFWMTATQQRRLRHLADTADGSVEEAFLHNTVQSYIEQHAESYLNDDLLHVTYIGQRDLTGDPNVSEATQSVGVGKRSGVNPVLEFMSLAAAGLLMVVVALGAVLAYRRRRLQRQAEPPGIDLDEETGAFPHLTPESSGSINLANGEETQDARPPREDRVPSNHFTGLSEVSSFGSNDDVLPEGRVPAPPSLLAAIGGASTFARQLSYSPRSDAEDTAHSDITEDHPDDLPGNMAPTILEASSDESSDEASADSTTFEVPGGDNDDAPAPPRSPFEDIEADGRDLAESYKDEDEPPQSGRMV